MGHCTFTHIYVTVGPSVVGGKAYRVKCERIGMTGGLGFKSLPRIWRVKLRYKRVDSSKVACRLSVCVPE
jgi:hypothetical protein